VSNVIEVEFHVSAEPVIPIDPEIEVAETHGVIARAVAAASKANKNLFIIPPGDALAGVCLASAQCRGLAKGKDATSIGCALTFKKCAMPHGHLHQDSKPIYSGKNRTTSRNRHVARVT
jgi:hypothetical protein